MSDVYDISLQDWWKTVEKMLDFMCTGQMGNFIFHPVYTFLNYNCTTVELRNFEKATPPYHQCPYSCLKELVDHVSNPNLL